MEDVSRSLLDAAKVWMPLSHTQNPPDLMYNSNLPANDHSTAYLGRDEIGKTMFFTLHRKSNKFATTALLLTLRQKIITKDRYREIDRTFICLFVHSNIVLCSPQKLHW